MGPGEQVMPKGEKRKAFLGLSSQLVGVQIDSFQGGARPARPGDLVPRNSPLDLTDVFIEAVETGLSDADLLGRLLRAFADRQVEEPGKRKALTAADAAGEMFRHVDYGPICRSIMKLWLLGVWYAPARPRDPVRVVSSQAYKEGLVWKIMQAHPQGYSTWAFGHWAEDPPKLEEFISPV